MKLHNQKLYCGDMCIDLRQMPEQVAARIERQLKVQRARLTPEQWQRIFAFISALIAQIIGGLSKGEAIPNTLTLTAEV